MEEKRFIINYYKNAASGIHIQKISRSDNAEQNHSHEYFQIYYILQGSILHFTGDRSCYLKKGDAFVIPPGVTHRIAEQTNSLFYTFSFTSDSLGSSCNSIALLSRFLNDMQNTENIDAKISLNNEEILFFEDIIDKIYREFNEKKLGYIDVIRTSATLLLTVLARYHFKSSAIEVQKTDTRDRIIDCIKFVDTNFAEQLRLDDMAKWCAMSKSEFCRQFSWLSGTTFQKYLHSVRIKHAIKLIEKDHSITSIYSFCGYNDFSTFYRNFKAITGCSPMQYRKLSKERQ